MFGCKRRRLDGRDSLGGTAMLVMDRGRVEEVSDELVKEVRVVAGHIGSLGFDAVNVAQHVCQVDTAGIVRDNDTHDPSALFFAV
jgi:hypothetical protein